MIRYSIDSTLTLRETPVFRSGVRGRALYDRKNRSEDGFSLSNFSKRKIKQYISGYFLENKSVGKNVSWVTLTVPPRIDGFAYQNWCDDPAIIKQLSKFLENLRKNHGLKNYVWVAERQDGKRNDYQHCTGAIHFHCVFDFEGFVDYRNLNLYWLKLMNEKGYKAFSREHFEKIKSDYFSIEKTYERYKKSDFADFPKPLLILPAYENRVKAVIESELKACERVLETQNLRTALRSIDPMTFNPEHPIVKIAYNPVDIDKIDMCDFVKLQTYLTKYVTKNETSIHGRVWGSSRGFSSVNYQMNITAAEAEKLKAVDSIVLHESEKTFDIGNNQYTTKSTKFDYKKFVQTDTYLNFMDFIFDQRLNPSPEIPKHIPVNEQYKFVTEAFKEIRSRTIFVNDEVRCHTIIYPASHMPINHEFYEQSDGIFKPKMKPEPNVQFELFEFVEKDKKTFK